MIVISLSTVPMKLRGYLSIYLWEIDTNVYVGNVSAKVRDLLWERINELVPGHGRAIMVYPAASEQGFDFRTCGTAYSIIDFEGLKLVKRPTGAILASEAIPNVVRDISRRSYQKSYVVVDLETTGLNVENDQILEIGAIKVINQEIKDRFQCIVKTNIAIPYEITNLTGITQEVSDNGIPFSEAITSLKSFISNFQVIGYNIVNYDARILHFECLRNRIEFPFAKLIDVLPLVKQAIPNLSSYSLVNVGLALGIKCENLHRALSDCMVCNEIYQKIFKN